MAALALAMKGVFKVQRLSPGLGRMAILTFLDRQSLPPGIPAAGIIVVAGGANHTGGFVGLMPEKHRAFGPGLEFGALQGTCRFGDRGAKIFGPQKHDDRQSQKERLLHPSPGESNLDRGLRAE
jgi:hypothetical protein